MDRIRRALDLARLEREQALEPPPNSAQPPVHSAATAATAATAAKVAKRSEAASPSAPAAEGNSLTRSFQAPAQILERNRILNPSARDSATVAFRMLRTQVIQRMDAHGWRTLAIFSPGANDGKTTMAANLALSLAGDHSHTVLLVELDLKRPSLAARFGFKPEFGTDDVVTGNARIQDCLYHPQGFERFVMMPARTALDNSSERLAGPRCRDMVTELRSRYADRIVVFDLPPVLSADDALSFAPLVECGLVVAAEGRTRRKDLVRTVELLHKTPLVGTVLNRATDSTPGY